MPGMSDYEHYVSKQYEQHVIKQMIERARELAALADKAIKAPWEYRQNVEQDEEGYEYPNGYRIYGEVKGEYRPMQVFFAEVGADDWGLNEARLIAAAPEMAMLLAQLADRLERITQGGRKCPE